MLKPSAMLLYNLTFLAIVLSIVTSQQVPMTENGSAEESEGLNIPGMLKEVKTKINHTISTMGSNIARVRKEIECLRTIQDDIKILMGNIKNQTKSFGDIKTWKKIEDCMIKRPTS